jgi:hypothetical protein
MVIRKRKKRNFTILDNSIFKNDTLSLKAKGMLCTLLSLPDEWEYSISGLATLCADGKAAVRSALNELEENGYFKRVERRENGQFKGYDYIIYEDPTAEEPTSENATSSECTQLNTKQLNTKESNTKEYTPLTPQGGNRGLKAIVEELPSETREAVQGFIEMRKKIRAPLTERALRMSIKKAMELSGGDVQTFIAIFDQSTERSWRGIFPLQKDKPKSTGNPFIDLLESGEFND